ncbi:hypothetical protein AB0M20_27005 [Actinoplanes sp. NPDC051633]|uniref:hypothetical protein n=1 Tax=Actinoplanes sp. NPDC051633 TaxID=3155670 RepID=UPI003416DDB1
MTIKPASTKDTRRKKRLRLTAESLQFGVLVLIVVSVGLMAGAASFTHVHDWTIDNSPTGTPDWFGWANAVISELIPTASIIEIARRRRRTPGCSVSYPMVLLVGAVGFSLTAQLAVAKPGLSGWIVSALPAVAFLGLSKLVFSATAHRPTHPVTAPAPAASPATSPDSTRAKASPAAVSTTRATTSKSTPAKKTPAKRTPAKKTPSPAPATTAPPVPAPAETPAPAARTGKQYPQPLLANARTLAVSHRAEHGEDISATRLAVRLRVPTADAADILTQLQHPPTPATTRPHNGSTVATTT